MRVRAAHTRIGRAAWPLASPQVRTDGLRPPLNWPLDRKGPGPRLPTPRHGRADILRRLVATIGAALQHVNAAAEEPFKDLDRWGWLLHRISNRNALFVGESPAAPREEANCRI